MPKAENLVGMRFGRWTVVREAKRRRQPNGALIRRVDVKCSCDNGIRRTVRVNDLRSGLSGSCGCLQREAARKAKTTHGQSYSREYRVWANMIRRCENPNASRYASYGGRGIRVCRQWRKSFVAFLKDMGPKPTPDHSIERKKVDGNYTPRNCHWATDEQQLANKRSMMKRLVGKTFGRLKVIKAVPGRYRFSVLCKCDNLKTVYGYDLLSGKTLSCGCLRSDMNKERKRTS